MNKIKIEKFTINHNKTIIEALRKINFSKHKILFVLKNKKFFGTIQDSDIRRALLNEFNTNLIVENFCRRDAKKVNYQSFKKSDFKKIFNKKPLIKAIPVVKKDKIIDIVFNQQNIIDKSIPILFFSGGKGIRMKPLTIDTPKPLVIINGKSILENQIHKLKKQGFDNFFISIKYLKKKFLNFKNNKKSFNLKILNEKEYLGTCASLINLVKRVDFENRSILTINGDILTNLNFENLINFHRLNDNDITVCIKELQLKIPYGIIKQQKNKLIDEKPTFFLKYNVGINIFDIKRLKKLNLNSTKFKGMDELINYLKKMKFKIGFFPIEEKLFHFTTKEDVLSFKKNEKKV